MGTIAAVATVAATAATMAKTGYDMANAPGGGGGGGGAGNEFSMKMASEMMGLYRGNSEKADDYIKAALGARTGAEKKRATLESQLGTETQLQHAYAGQYNLPGRKNKDSDALRAKLTELYGRADGKQFRKDPEGKAEFDATRLQIKGELDGVMAEANALRAEAMALAKAGDTEGADELLTQAGTMIEEAGLSWDTGGKGGGKRSKGTVSISGREELQASAATPMGMTVGKIVARGNELADPDSQESLELRQRLTDPAFAAIQHGVTQGERHIRSQYRQTQRDIQDMGAGRGAGRSVMGESAIAARASDAVGYNLAQLHSEAGKAAMGIVYETEKWAESYSTAYAADSVSLGRQYVDGSPHIREAYVQGIQNINLAGAAIAGQLAGTAMNAAAQLAGGASEQQGQYNRQQQQFAQDVKNDQASMARGIMGLGVQMAGGAGRTLMDPDTPNTWQNVASGMLGALSPSAKKTGG